MRRHWGTVAIDRGEWFGRLRRVVERTLPQSPVSILLTVVSGSAVCDASRVNLRCGMRVIWPIGGVMSLW